MRTQPTSKALLVAWLALAVMMLGPGCTTRSPTPAAAPPATPPPSTPGPSSTATAPPVPATPVPAVPADPVPARLGAQSAGAKSAGAQSRGKTGAADRCLAQIEEFAELHTGNRVILGPAAFADSDQLVLTRMPARGRDGLTLDGRAAPPQPVVLNLLAGPRGCVVRLAEAARPEGSQSPPASTPSGSQPARSAPLPDCECVALSR